MQQVGGQVIQVFKETSIEKRAVLDGESVGEKILIEVGGNSSGVKSWPAYSIAVVATAATLGLRLALADQLKDRPTLIVFTIPIMLSAYVGGLRAGLLATALSYVGASYYLLPPFHSFQVASVVDRWDLFFVMLAGAVISGLNEALHRARRRAAEAIRARAERDRKRFFALSQDVLCTLGFDGYFQNLNPAWENTLGYTKAEILATPFIEFVHPDDRPATLAAAVEVAGGKALLGFENRYRCKDGTYRWFQWSVTPVIEERVMYGVARDVTERKQEETASAQLAAIVDSSDDAIIGKDLNGIITSWNKGAKKIFGYTASEMRGTSIMRLIPPGRQDEEKQILEKIRGGGSVEHFETLRQTKDGRLIDISVTASPITDLTGTVTGVSKVARDITDRKLAEQEIQKLNAGLEQRVLERTQELEAANKELEAFSYSVSHDLRAPLRGVDGFIRMLQEDCAGQLDAEGNRLLGVVSSEARRMGRLIDDLLAFSRLGRERMKSSAIDPTDLARTVFDELTQATPESAPRLEIHPLPPIQGDPSMLRQVFTNLLGNAVKFTRYQPVPVIEVGGRSGDGENTYYIKDNGVGYDEKYGHKLFGVFQRLHSEDEFEGTGVGLALVQRIINRHGGKVWAEGKPDQGATFYFTLPIINESTHEQ